MNPIYRGQYPPKNTNVLWIKGKKIFVFGKKGWEDVTESTVVDTELDPTSNHPIANSAVAASLSNAEETLSETSENLIKNKAVYNQYMTDEDIENILDIIYPEIERPLTFEILTIESGGTPSITWNNSVQLQYNKNNAGWNTTTQGTPIAVAAGDIVQFKGNSSLITENYPSFTGFSSQFCTFNLKGNIMSLIGGGTFSELKSMRNSRFSYLFKNMVGLKNANKLQLPATELSQDYCYSYMFLNCTNLETAPTLPAEDLSGTRDCYCGMFSNCTSLKEVPVLPATILGERCYSDMFDSCTGLTSVPANLLPATTLTKDCYIRMFARCSSLTNCPNLPALNLAEGCYSAMFVSCSSLKVAPALLATTLVKNCYSSMFSYSSVESMVLPAPILAEGCYSSMFSGCNTIKLIEMRATDISAQDSILHILLNAYSAGTLRKVQGVNYPRGNDGIPYTWTIEDLS